MIEFDFDKKCYGCSACAYICPKDAIKMYENEEGFLMPKVNMDKCIQCGLCKKKCPQMNQVKSELALEERKYYAFYIKDKNTVLQSTSGGAFYSIASNLINEGWYICGCVWDDDMHAKHIVTNRLEDVKKMRKSKYVQSNIEDVYSQIEKKLKEKKNVLFTGTPCQVAGILGQFSTYETLYTASLFCEGVPSPKVWRLYKNVLNKKYKSKMVYADFRYKQEHTWSNSCIKYTFENGAKIEMSPTIEPYILSFYNALTLRNSCYNCQYKGDNLCADLLLGDFWGATREDKEENKNVGISVVGINSRGRIVFEKRFFDSYIREIQVQQAIGENKVVLQSISKNKCRDKFFKRINEKNMQYKLIRFYNNNPIKYYIKKFLVQRKK